MSAEALSKTAGLGHGAVSGLEARVRLPRVNTLERLADVLCVSPGWLAFGLESPWEPAKAPRCAGLRDRLRDAAAMRDLSLREVARRADAGEGVAVSVVRGTMPSLNTLEELAKALQVSPAWLAFGEGPRELPRRRGKPAPAAAAP